MRSPRTVSPAPSSLGIPDPTTCPFMSPEEVLERVPLPIRRSAFYAALRAGEIPGARKVGNRWVIATAALRRWACLDD